MSTILIRLGFNVFFFAWLVAVHSLQADDVEFASARYEATEGDSAFILLRHSDSSQTEKTSLLVVRPVTGSLAEDMSNTSGEDPLKMPITFAPYAGFAAGVLEVRDDGIAEGDEEFSLSLEQLPDGPALGGRTNAILLVHNRAPELRLVSPFQVIEGQTLDFMVQRAGDRESSLEVEIETTNAGTAIASKHFVPAHGTIHFAPFQTKAHFPVITVQDASAEADRTVEVRVFNPSLPTKLVNDKASATILEDDVPSALDVAFRDPSLNGVTAVGVQSSGKILVFWRMDGTAPVVPEEALRYPAEARALKRLNIDGGWDASFKESSFNAILGDGPFGIVRVVVDVRDRVILYGDFSSLNGHPAPRLVRLLPDGQLDPSFQADLSPITGSDGPPLGLIPLRDGGYVAWTSNPRVIRLKEDGSVSWSFPSDPSSVGVEYVEAAVVQDSGKVIAKTERGFLRLNLDGSVDPSFITNNLSIYSEVLDTANDKLIIRTGDTQQSVVISRLLSDGELDPSFQPFLASNNNFIGILNNRILTTKGWLDSKGAVVPVAIPDKVRPTGFFQNGGLLVQGDYPWLVLEQAGSVDWPFYGGPLRRLLLTNAPATSYELAGNFGSERDGWVYVGVRRLGDSSRASEITLSTADGTAKAGEQYLATNVVVRFAPFEVSKSIAIALIDDHVARGVTRFSVRLSEPSDAGPMSSPLEVLISDSIPQFFGVLRSEHKIRVVGSVGATLTLESSSDLKNWKEYACCGYVGILDLCVDPGDCGDDLPRQQFFRYRRD